MNKNQNENTAATTASASSPDGYLNDDCDVPNVNGVCPECGFGPCRRASAPSRDAAQPIKTWQERLPENVRQIGTAASESPYKDAEIADLRAALAEQK